MRAGVTLLADDGDYAVVVPAVSIAVTCANRLDLGGVRRNFDLVALARLKSRIMSLPKPSTQ